MVLQPPKLAQSSVLVDTCIVCEGLYPLGSTIAALKWGHTRSFPDPRCCFKQPMFTTSPTEKDVNGLVFDPAGGADAEIPPAPAR